MYKYGYGYHVGKIQDGALLNLPEWTNSPFFALPERGIDIIADQEVTIYGDALINVPIENELTVEYICSIGTQSGNNFTINEDTPGTYSLNIKFKQSNKQFYEVTVNVNVIAAITAEAIKLLMVGDSLVVLGHEDIATGINADLLPEITFIGTQGTTIKHEGVAGKTYGTILTTGSPFFIGGAFDIEAYFTDNSLATPDYVLIRFGVNDVFIPDSYVASDSYFTNQIINPSKTLVNAFLAYNPDLKIIIGLPTITENSGAGWNANYDESLYNQNTFIQNIHRLWQFLIATYDDAAHSDRVIVSNEAIFLDRDNGYPKTAGVHNNGVHPAPSGYQQLGNGIANTINKDLSLMPSGLTLELISGGVKLDWLSGSDPTFETEIWGKSDDAAYSLLYTIAAGTVTKSELLDAVDLRYYKIRGKSGTYFTQFTAEQSIAMLGSELVVNGDFSAWTGDNPNNWIVNEGANGYFTEVAGTCRMVVTGSGVSMAQSILTNGAKYRFKVNVITVVSEQLSVVYSSLKYTNFSTTGQKSWYDITDGTQLIIRRWSGNTDVTFDDVSVKRVLMP